MELNDKISWLMDRVQKSLFPHLNECFESPPLSRKNDW